MHKKRAPRTIISFVMVVFILTSFTLPVSAKVSKVDGYNDGSLYDNFYLGQSGDPSNLEMWPGEEIRIPLTADLFTFKDGKIPISNEALTYGQLSRVRVRTRVRAGSETLDYVQFDQEAFDGRPFIRPGGTTPTSTTTYISVIFAREFASTKDVPFDFTIYLSVDNRPYDDDLSITLAGELKVETTEVYKDTTYVDLSEGMVAHAMESVSNVCADLGTGVEAYVNMTSGSKYYGTAKFLDVYSGDIDKLNLIKIDMDLPDVYPRIAGVYKLNSIGLNRPSTKVKLEVERSKGVYYIYGEDLTYLGTNKDDLPFSKYYFITYERMPEFDSLPQNINPQSSNQ